MSAETSRKTILIGEDDPDVRCYLETTLRCYGYNVERAADGDEVLTYVKEYSPAAVLLDLNMPIRDGMNTLMEIRKFDSGLPVIVLSALTSTPTVVEAMRRGASDFLSKPVAHEQLTAVLQKALASDSSGGAGQPAGDATGDEKVVYGSHPRMQEIRDLVPRLGRSDVPVLILGETGTGKEVLARQIHRCSTRSESTFVKLNCAALPSELVESELFGYERGAFTGALARKPGLFEVANGGTIFLDEIGDMDFALQAKLLQVLQDGEFRRVGGKENVKVNVRVVAATHQDLEHRIQAKQFRADLFYRLNVFTLQLPSLRERREDILSLAEFFLRRHAHSDVLLKITPSLENVILAYDWPGNIRELENTIRKLLVLGDCDAMTRELRSRIPVRGPEEIALVPFQGPAIVLRANPLPGLQQVWQAKEEAEAETILAALTSTQWNRKRAAKLLDIDYKALLYKMKKLSIGESHAAMVG